MSAPDPQPLATDELLEAEIALWAGRVAEQERELEFLAGGRRADGSWTREALAHFCAPDVP